MGCVDGWFEVSDGDWQPLEPNISPAQSWALAFTAATVESDATLTSGQLSTTEKCRAGSTAFCGIRHSKSANGSVLLFLPPVPESPEADSELVISEDADTEIEEANTSWCIEDPEV